MLICFRNAIKMGRVHLHQTAAFGGSGAFIWTSIGGETKYVNKEREAKDCPGQKLSGSPCEKRTCAPTSQKDGAQMSTQASR